MMPFYIAVIAIALAVVSPFYEKKNMTRNSFLLVSKT